MVVGVQENQGYGIGFGIPTIFFAVAITAFIVGALFKLYVKVPAEGSPFTRIFRVLKGKQCWQTYVHVFPSGRVSSNLHAFAGVSQFHPVQANTRTALLDNFSSYWAP